MSSFFFLPSFGFTTVLLLYGTSENREADRNRINPGMAALAKPALNGNVTLFNGNKGSAENGRGAVTDGEIRKDWVRWCVVFFGRCSTVPS